MKKQFLVKIVLNDGGELIKTYAKPSARSAILQAKKEHKGNFKSVEYLGIYRGVL